MCHLATEEDVLIWSRITTLYLLKGQNLIYYYFLLIVHLCICISPFSCRNGEASVIRYGLSFLRIRSSNSRDFTHFFSKVFYLPGCPFGALYTSGHISHVLATYNPFNSSRSIAFPFRFSFGGNPEKPCVSVHTKHHCHRGGRMGN